MAGPVTNVNNQTALTTWMAHQQQIIEVEYSDEEEFNESTPVRRAGTLSNHPPWSIFAPPNASSDLGEDDTLSEEEENVNDYDDHRSQQPSTSLVGSNSNPRPQIRLLDLLHQTVPGPSTSRRTKIKMSPSSPSNHLRSLPGALEDERIRSLLDLSPFDSSNPSNALMPDDNTPMEDMLDLGGSSLDAQNTALTMPTISEYQCPICFSPPSHACLTPCGHIMCAQCLFSSVRAARERHVRLYGRGAAGPEGEGKVSRCPVCRAVMKGWDGKGGGVFGLKMEMKGANERTEIIMPF